MSHAPLRTLAGSVLLALLAVAASGPAAARSTTHALTVRVADEHEGTPLPAAPGYWVTGVMGQWRVGPARLFLNLENVLDTQQTDYGPVVLGPRAAPPFAETWAPTDGFVANGGVGRRTPTTP